MTTTSSSSKASKRRTRRKKQNLSVGITGNTDTDVESGGRQRAPTKIIPGEAIIAQSRQAEARSEVQHRTRRTEQPARAEQHDRINSSNLNNHRQSHSTCPSNLIPTETIQIGSADGKHYIHYERQKLPPEEEKKRKAAKRRPQYDAFLCKRGSDERVILKRHPQTGDPFVERNISKLVSKIARCPDGRSIYRIDVVDRDEGGNAHVASVCWVHTGELDKNVRHRLRLDCNEWKDGDAMKMLKSVYIKARDSEHLTKASKSTASGCYAEIGWGAGAGPQNSSFNAAPPGSSKRDGVAFPYARNPELASEIEPCLGEGLSIVNMFLEDHCPDLHMREKRNEGSHASLATSDGLCFPRPPTKGILKGQKTMNAHQIALRLCGWCQAGGAKGAITNPTDLDVHFPSGTRQEKESLKRLNKSRYGGSGLHVDWRDPDSRMGAATLYLCFVEHGASNGDHETRLLEDCDLLIFQKKTGGRAICVETMKVGHVCVVFHHSKHLHGSVFKINGMPQILRPGVEALKIVCYHTLHKLVSAEDVDNYMRGHSEFLLKLLRRKWYRLALCHAVSLIRIVKAALAHSNTAAQRNVYRTILHRVWRDILPVFAMEGREGQSKPRQTSFGWAHSMLGLNLICYYRRDSGVIILRRKK